MKQSSILVIKLALLVQFFALLAVPVLVAADEAPRAMWMAEWIRADATDLSPVARSAKGERTIGVLRLRDGKVSFVEQLGQVDWELDFASVKKVAAAGGRVILTSLRGEEFVVVVMETNLVPMSPKKVAAAIERAIQVTTTLR